MSTTETKTASGVILAPDLVTRYRLAESQLALLPPPDEDDAEEWAGLRQHCEEVMLFIERLSAAEERERVLRGALEKAQTQLSVARRFLPSHGSFGEEGVSNYRDAQDAVDAALATLAPAQPDCPHHHPFRKMTNNGWEFWCEDCGVLIHQPVPSAVNVSATPAHTEGK